MEDIMESAVTADTIPPTDEEGAGQPVEESATETGAGAAERGTVSGAQPEIFSIRYNHEAVEMPLADARRAVQHYLHLTRDGGAFDQLAGLAAVRGVSVEELVESVCASDERELREKLLADADGNREIADRLYELEKIKRGEALTAARQSRVRAAEREKSGTDEQLRAQFAGMKDEFGLTAVSDLPNGVVTAATEEGIPLRDAYLRHLWAEHCRREQNRRQQKTAAAASPGSQADGIPDAQPSSFELALMRGLNRVVT